MKRGFSVFLCFTTLLWAFAAQGLSARAARGLAERFGLLWGEPLLNAGCWLFLFSVGVGALRWITSHQDAGVWPRRVRWRSEFGLGAAVGWGLALLCVLPILLSGHLHLQVSLRGRLWGATAVSLLTLAVLTAAEELVFRGFAFRLLIAAVGPSWATLALSGVFAGAVVGGMGSVTAFVVTWLLGILLAIGYLRSHALWIPWGVHFSFRAVTAVALGLPIAGRAEFGGVVDGFATGPGWLSGGPFGPDAAAFTLVAMVAAIAVLVRATRWHAWEYTHPAIVAGGYEVTVAPPAAHTAMELKSTPSPPPLVQILAATPQNRSAMDEASRYEQPS